MRRNMVTGVAKILLSALAVWAFSLPAPAGEEPKAKPISATAGKEFEIKLASDLRSDYQWLLAKPLDPGLLKFVSRSFQRPAPGARNATGTEVLIFKALAEGKTSVFLKYCQVRGQHATSSGSTNFTVQITAAGGGRQR